MDISKIIVQLGYKSNEVKVYLAALGNTEVTASLISNKTNLPLSSTQLALEKLHKDGLVNFYIRKNLKYWTAEPLERLMDILKEKEEELASAIKDTKPAVRREFKKPEVKLFIGADEVKLVHRNIVQSKHHILAIIPLEAWVGFLGHDFLKDFINIRVSNFLNIRMLTYKTPDSIVMKEAGKKELRHIKFLPRDINIEDVLFIFGDSVAMISLGDQPTSIVINDPATARMMTIFFENTWEKGSE